MFFNTIDTFGVINVIHVAVHETQGQEIDWERIVKGNVRVKIVPQLMIYIYIYIYISVA